MYPIAWDREEESRKEHLKRGLKTIVLVPWPQFEGLHIKAQEMKRFA